MASNLTDDLQHIIECSVCLVKYEVTSRTPKILSCGHTFCASCLQTLEEGRQLTCPTCRTVCRVPHTGLKDLPSNHSVISMLESVCGECNERFKQETCPHCKRSLCSPCLLQHTQLLATEVRDDIKELQTAVSGMQKAHPIQASLDTIYERISAMRSVVVNKVAVQNKEFVSREKKAQEQFMEESNTRREKFMEEQQSHEHQLSRIDEIQRGVVDKVIKQEHYRSELIPQWREQIESLAQDMDTDLTVQQLAAFSTKIQGLQTQIESCNVDVNELIDSGNLTPTVEEKEKFRINARCDLSTLSYYRKIKQPTFSLCGMTKGLEAGYSSATFSPICGNIYVADYYGCCIIGLNDTGHYLSLETDRKPRGVCTQGDKLIVSFVDHLNVYRLNDQHLLKEITENDIGLGNCSILRGLASGPKGDLYVADTEMKRILTLGQDNNEWRVHAVFGSGPRCVAVHPDGSVIVGTHGTHPELWKVSADGTALTKIKLPVQQPRENEYGYFGMCIDKDGYILLADRGSHSILVTDTSGHLHCRIGEKGSHLGQFLGPAGVAVTDSGRLVVTEMDHRRVQIF